MNKNIETVKTYFEKWYNKLNLFGKIYYNIYGFIYGVQISILVWWTKISKRKV